MGQNIPAEYMQQVESCSLCVRMGGRDARQSSVSKPEQHSFDLLKDGGHAQHFDNQLKRIHSPEELFREHLLPDSEPPARTFDSSASPYFHRSHRTN
jgi:hypothetical protein